MVGGRRQSAVRHGQGPCTECRLSQPVHDLPPDTVVADLASTRDGSLWVAGQTGLWRLHGSDRHEFTVDNSPIPAVYADLLTVERQFDEDKGRQKKDIAVDDVRRIAPFLRLTAAEGGWRVVILDGTDGMNRAGQNAVLKIFQSQQMFGRGVTYDPELCEPRDPIGEVVLTFPTALPKGSPIEVYFRLDEDGRLDVEGKDLDSRTPAPTQSGDRAEDLPS